MSNSLPNCISRLVTNRSQNPNFKTSNGFLKNLVATFALVFLLLGANTNVNAQTNANCYGPYNPTPATVWGIAEKFQSNPVIWNGCTPTAADLDGDGISEILATASDNSGYFVYKGNGSNKTTATKKYVIATSNARSVQPAIANIIGAASSAPEVVMVNSAGFVYIFDNVAGTETNFLFKSTTASQYTNLVTPYIVDIDEDGTAEIVLGSDIFGIVNGALVKRVAGTPLNYIGATSGSTGTAIDVVVVDIIASNPGKELVYGSRVYAVNMTAGSMTVLKDLSTIAGSGAAAGDNGPTAVADMDLDGDLDIVYNGSVNVYIWDPNQSLVLFKRVPPAFNYGVRGLPLIANVYNEKVNNGKTTDLPEAIIINSSSSASGIVTAYNLNFTTATGSTNQFIWSFGTNDMSGSTGITAFDFDGNGIREIVYRDQSLLRIINGNLANPVNYASIAVTSATWGEYPIVGDFDNDGQADIAVTGNNMLRVFNRAANTFDWQDAPSYWNQRNYRIVNINPNLTVPTTETSVIGSASVNNNMAQLQFLDAPAGTTAPYGTTAASDATIAITSVTGSCPALTVLATITNNGAVVLKSGTSVALYNGNPTTTNAVLVGTYVTTAAVAPGATLNVTIPLTVAINISTLYAVVNDLGTTARPYNLATQFPNSSIIECNYTNNMAFTAVVCLDSDNDGTSDVVDLDDDNDGVLDAAECDPSLLREVDATVYGKVSRKSWNGATLTEDSNPGWMGGSFGALRTDSQTPLYGEVTIPAGAATLNTEPITSLNFPLENYGVVTYREAYVRIPQTAAFQNATQINFRAGAKPNGPWCGNVLYISHSGAAITALTPVQGGGGNATVMGTTTSANLKKVSQQKFNGTINYVGFPFIMSPANSGKWVRMALSTQDGGAFEAGLIEYSLGPVTSTTVWSDVDASAGFQFSATGLEPDAPLVCDTDNDGIENRLDTDSDADGCPDAVEAGVTYVPSSGVTGAARLTTSVIAGPYGTNGFANSLETTTDNGTYVGTYVYANAILATVNGCTDSDVDGIVDIVDIDDDNDGVLDVTEQNCGMFSCVDIDTDGDGTPNRLDKDSDGDGCSDAREAGATTLTTANFAFTSAVGINGLADALETTTDNGIINYASTYTRYAVFGSINFCTDTDTDGIVDFIDIDDDNDGTLDATESPACFFNANEWNTTNKSNFVTISSELDLLAPNTAIQNLTDGTGGTTAAMQYEALPAQSQLNKALLKFEFFQPTQLDAIYIQKTSAVQLFAATAASLKVQASNNNTTWTDVTAAITLPANVTNVTANGAVSLTNSNKFVLTTNLASYKYYRIYGVVAANVLTGVASEVYFDVNTSAYQQSAFPKPGTCSVDLDNDTKPNHLDSDSDGDGCSDAKEAAATTSNTANFAFTTAVGTNGLANALETATDNAALNYASTYDPVAISANIAECADTDIDGILNPNDIDDDNDGILDIVESPSCFYFRNDWNLIDKSFHATVSSELNALAPNTNYTKLTDGIGGTTAAVQFVTATAQAQLNKELFKVTFSKAVQLDTWYIKKTSATQIFAATAASLRVQGSNNNTTWNDLTAAIASPADATNVTANGAVSLTNSNKFIITQNAAKYKYYRIYGVVAGNVLAGIASEFYFDVNATGYDASIFPRAVCDSDTDGDGIYNYLDLDSDGDGCSDALEAGATTSTTANFAFPTTGVGTNGLADALETVADNGTINYTATHANAYANNIAYCADTDQDGIGNTDDIDDDNDGVLDAVESPNCFYLSNDWLQGDRSQIFVTTQLAMTAGQDQPNKIVNGTNLATDYDVRFVATTTGAPKEVFRFEMPTPIALSKIYLGYTAATTVFGASTGITVRGSMDGSTWTNLSAQTTYAVGPTLGAVPGVAGTTPASEFTVTQNVGKYRYYALVWTGGGSITNGSYVNEAYFKTDVSYVPSSAPKPVCNNDTDGDGKPNHIDTDSDGDGCADIVEAGVSTTVTATVLTGTMGANGFANAVETTPESSTYNGTYTYMIARDASVNACTDSDGDGTTNVNDLDDDNDGVLDNVECPAPGVTPLTPKFNIVSGAAQTQTITGFPDELYIDIFDIDNNFSLNVNGTYITSVQEINLAWSGGLEYTAGSTWATLPDGTFLNGGSTWTYSGTKHLLRVVVNKFGEVKLMGLNQTTNTYQEMILRSANFNKVPINLTGTNTFTLDQDPQYNPTYANAEFNALYNSGFCDTDGDGIQNGLDLDSDGDGCFDAIEAKVLTTSSTGIISGSYGANGFADSKETAAESGVYNASYFYNYAVDNTVNFCKDSDNDGVSDVVDIDDDNDGVLDAVESPTCFYSVTEISKPVAAYTELNTYGLTNVIYFMSNAVDGDAATISAFATGQNWVGKSIIELEAPVYTAINSITFDCKTWPLSTAAANTFKLQGSGDGINWTDLSAAQASLTTVPATLVVANTLVPNGIYKYFRLVGVAGVSGYGGIAEATFNIPATSNSSMFPKASCTTDLDADTKLNHLDLDSDGDGCSDAIEAGSSTTATSTSVYPTGTDANANGLLNNYEGATAGTINYESTYSDYALTTSLNGCTDTDSDGITDVKDIDDDNDGVLDATESPSCFYTSIELSKPIAVSTELAPYTTNVITNCIDNSATSFSAFAPTVNWVNKEIFKFTALDYIGITGITFDLINWSLSSTVAMTFKLQGSSNESSWTDLSPAVASTTGTGTFTISNTLATSSKFKYYRIVGVAGTSNYGGVTNATFNLSANTILSESPKANCINDTDGDNIVNHLDLDSDDDGCSDAIEAGSSTTATSTSAYPTGADANANGLLNNYEGGIAGTINYTSSYALALSNNVNACIDTDNDGIKDITDIDDDNDGITDIIELSCTPVPIPNGTCTPAQWGAATYGIFTHCSGWNAFDFDPSPTIVDRSDFDYMGLTGTDPYFDLQGSFTTPLFGKIYKIFTTVPGMTYTFDVTLMSVFTDALNGSKPYIKAIDNSNGIILGSGYMNGTGYRTVTFIATSTSTMITFGHDSRVDFSGNQFWRGGNLVQNGGPSQECALLDSDNDGIPNHLDTDSDGDGCSDAKEAGTTTSATANYTHSGPYGANGFANALETVADNGIYNGTYVYNYAIDATQNLCIDTDGDGIGDLIDLDDDNDGVLDATELACTQQVTSKTGLIITKPATINYTFNGNTISNLIDGVDANVYVASGPTGTLNNSPWLNFEFPAPVALSYLEIGHYSGQTLFATTSTYKIQGSTDNTTWTDVSGTLTYNNIATSTSGGLSTNNSNIANFPSNTTAYKYYRIFGIAATSGGGWATEIYFKQNNCTWDVDNDGITNDLDLDSDGDGCSDAKEAGSSTTATSTTVYPTGTDANNNGLLNNYEGTTAGTINYTSTYSNYALSNAINSCTDTDGDGKVDVIDLDDDNDGVIDLMEQSCIEGVMSKTGITVSSTVNWVFQNAPTGLNALLDGNLYQQMYPSDVNLNNKTILQFNLPTQKVLNLIELANNPNQTPLVAGGTYKLQGSNDGGTTWIDIVASQVVANTSPILATTNSIKFDMPQNYLAFSSYRVYGIVISGQANWAQEVYFRELICTNDDADSDGIPNSLDLDSDGDGCSDAKEAGSSTTATSTSVYPTGTDTNANGLLNNYESTTAGSVNYTSTYAAYALSNSINACTDSDNDGIVDVNDIDDDNDGVLDAEESVCASSLMPKAGVTVSSPATWIYSNGATSLNALVDGIDGTTYQAYTSATFIDAPILQFDLPKPAILTQIEIGNYPTQTVLANGGTFKMQGWDGTQWGDIGIVQEVVYSASINATNNSNKFSMVHNLIAFSKYRILGINAQGSNNAQEAYFTQKTCTDIDNDSDGIPNRLDLDSDGDGCADAIEASSSTTATSTLIYPTGADANTNGLNDNYEVSTLGGSYNYTSTYEDYALSNTINACLDTDSDGITDFIDIDDDNDGILDAAEMTACATMWTPTAVTSSPFYGSSNASLTINNSGLNGSGLTATVDVPNTLSDTWYLLEPNTTGFLEYTLPANTTVGGVVLWAPDATNYGGGDGPVKDFKVEVIYNNVITYTSPTYTTAQPIGAGSNGGAQVFYLPKSFVNPQKIRLIITAGWYDVNNNNGIQVGTETLAPGTVNGAYNMTLSEFKVICAPVDIDTDGDGIPNRLDLDSDGDACADAIEAGGSTTATSTSAYPSGTDANSNGLLNNYEGATSGTISYTSTYTEYALINTINMCTDSDVDGVSDFFDIDDDNDGVFDAVESPTCFFTANEWNTAAKSYFAKFSSQLSPSATNNFNALGDGNATTAAVQIQASQDQNNKELFKIEMMKPTQLDAIYIKKTTATQIFGTTAASLKVQGSNNNSTWTDLTAAIASPADATNITANGAVSLTNSNKFTLSSNPGAYKYFRIYGVAASNTVGGIASEIYFDVNVPTYNASRYPKATCISDSDGDGTQNHLDLDSDNDGCSDANEAYNTSTAQGTDGNMYYGTGNPPAVNANGSVTGATYPGTNAAVTTAGSASTITAQPTDQSVASGATATFAATVTVGSGTTNYQWQVSTNGGSTWTNVTNAGVYTGATTATLTITGVTSTMNEYRYRLQISQSNFACGNLTTNAARLILANNVTIINDNVSTPEDTPISGNVLTNDSGSGSTAAALTVTEFTVAGLSGTFTAGTTATIPGVGTIVVNANGSFTFTPVANYNGTVPAITYTATDTNGGSGTGILNITVTPVNDAPVATDDVVSGNEDTPISGNVLTNDTDADGNTLSVTSFTINGVTYNAGDTATIPGVGTIVVNADGTYTFTPALDYTGNVPDINYTISDGNGGTDSGLLDIVVNAVNDAPLASDDIVTTPEDVPVSGNVLTNDTDLEGNTLTVTQFTIAGLSGTFTAGTPATIPGVGTIVVNADGSFTFTPVLDYTGNVPAITYTVSDGNSTDTALLTIFVAPVNDAPIANNDVNTVNEDTPATGNVLSNDTDTDTPLANLIVTQISFTLNGTTYTYPAGTTASIPGVGTIVVNANGTYVFTPNANWNGTVPVITYTISDGEGGTDTGTLAITVTAVNDSPITVNDDNLVTPEDTPISGNVLTNDSDPEGNPITVTQFTIFGVTGTFTAGQTATISGVGTIVVNANGTFTFTPAANYSGIVPLITYTATDINGGSNTANLGIIVSPVNDVPDAVNDVATTLENTLVSGNVLTNDTDSEGNTLTVTQFTINGVTYAAGSIVNIPGVGVIVVNADGTYTFTPNSNYSGTVPVITYTVSDGNGGTDTATLTIAITPVNDPPVVVSESLTTAEDTPLTGNVLSNDTDQEGNTLAITQFTVGGQTFTAGQIATIPGVGTIVVNANGTFTFTPVANYNGVVPVIGYTVSDGTNAVDGSLSIVVTAVNDAPVATDETATTPQNIPVSGSVLTNDTDVEGNTLTVTQFTIAGISGTFTAGQTATIPGVGTLVVNADGTYTFTPATNYYGPVPVTTYTVSDGNGGTDTGTLSLSVTPVDTDGDGVMDFQELIDGTDPTNPCSFLTASQIITPSAAWAALDCDGDGTPNGTDTAPLNPCIFAAGATPVTTNAIWAAADCDNDGETNGTENTNGTNPNNPCSYTTAPTATSPAYATWSALDCDGDGTPNGTDTAPLNPCIFAAGATPVTTNAIWAAADCDNDGETNGTENTNGTNPNNPCSYTTAPTASSPAYATWSALDCDGDGTPNGIDTAPLDPCIYAAGATPVTTNAIWQAADCDNDGETNGTENTNGTDPNNPCSYTTAPTASSPAYATWSVLDCDGDGTPNGTDTAPLNPCIFTAGATPVTTNAIWQAADCDGDGETNGTENTNGTNPNNPCSYTTAPAASSPAYATWSALDCDGDGTPNGTDSAPFDPCIHAVGATPDVNNALWQAADCDGDGTPNGTDSAPNNPCVGGSGTPVTSNAIWAAADCDNDGETNGTENTNGTNPNNPCSYTTAPATTSPAYATWSALDCDNDGLTNGVEITGGTNPLNPDSDGDGNPDNTDPNPTTPTATNDTANASPGSATTINILGNDDFLPNDGNTITQTGGTATGTVSFNPITGTMTYTPAAGEVGTTVTVVYQVCQGSVCATATVTITVAPADSDGDGVNDAQEAIDGTNPNNPCSFVLASQNTTPTAAWLAADCDGDGTPNGTDTSPLDPCIYAIGSTPDITNPVWQAADCDGDGLTNNTEGLDDTDGDGIPDFEEVDSDGDGIPDAVEAGPNPNNPVDTDGDGTPDYQDTDSDGDGIPDSVEDSGCTGTAPCTPTDTDGDGIPNYLDVDSDGDGIPDSVEDSGCTGTAPCTPTDTDGDGIPNYLDVDSDGDGIPDSVEDSGCTGTAPCTPTDTDGDGIPNYLDVDSDGDGIPDSVEDSGCTGTAPCTPTDTDGDGIPNYLDQDSDGDGIPDSVEDSGCTGTAPCTPTDTDGDGIPNYLDVDSDGDGIPDSVEDSGCTGTAPCTPTDTDGDGIPNYLDVDSDGDGIPDSVEDSGCTGTAPCTPTDTDGDGIPNYLDVDSDGDGIPDSVEDSGCTGTAPCTPTDTDGDGIPNYLDVDSDGDGIPDSVEDSGCTGTAPCTPTDTDGDGIPNYLDVDSDGDGIPDSVEDSGCTGTAPCTPTDTDGDGIPNYLDQDSDGDGIPDSVEDSGCTGTAPCTPTDTDGDGIPNYLDVDSDGDGIPDSVEDSGCTGTAPCTPTDTDGDGIPNYLDVDSDGDGIPDSVEDSGCTGTAPCTPTDTDGDGIPNYLDVDSDGDGIPDSVEDSGCTGTAPCTPTDTDGDGIPNYLDVDSDGDGIPDSVEDSGCTGTAPCTPTDTDGDGIPNYLDQDSDGDGIPDSVEDSGCTGTAPCTPTDTDGDGIPNYLDVDSDGDGIPDSVEDSGCTGTAPCTPTDTDGDGIPNYLDVDSDGDGIPDSVEDSGCTGTAPCTPTDTDGDGIPNYLDVDSDGDGIPDSVEDSGCTGTAPCTPTDTDGDGIPNYLDVDSDGDGIPDSVEDSGCTGTAPCTPTDTDGDGIPNYLDVDSDGDGIPDSVEDSGCTGTAPCTPTDTDGDGIPNYLDQDSDGDGIPDSVEDSGCTGTAPCTPTDTDGDGIPNYLDVDSDGDGIPDSVEDSGCTGTAPCTPTDTDGDGIPNYLDVDSDGDGIPDATEDSGCTGTAPCTPTDTDGDGIPNYLDVDSDGDGIPDSVEDSGCTGTAPCTPTDTDGDGIPNYLDVDSDGDGIPDSIEDSGCTGTAPCTPTDTDGDGIPNYLDQDSDGDGIPDSVEDSGCTGTAPCTPTDTDGDGIPNYLDVDSDGDGIPDSVEDSGCTGTAPCTPTDTDGDGIPNYLDVDSDGDGIPDSVEDSGCTGTAPCTPTDTDGDGIPNYLDVDSDGDGIPDSVEDSGCTGTAPCTPTDTDGDGIPNYLDQDSDGDGIPDSVEDSGCTGTAPCTPTDTDGDGIPNYLDVDSDGDGIPDSVEDSGCTGTAPCTPTDTDGDGTPNYLDLDSDGDGVTDAQETIDGTNPLDPCDLVIANITLPPTGMWLSSDCDGDGVTNGQEVIDGTDPTNPCESKSENVTLPLSQDFLNGDCDGDGLLNGVEIGQNPTNPLDSNGNGIPDYLEVNNHSISEDELEIFSAVSPNGDGDNDVFVIRNIENYPDNSVSIYNRWGVAVYEVDGYGQDNKYFKGISEGRITIKQQDELPVGTYFYIIRYKNNSGEQKQRSGYLYINR